MATQTETKPVKTSKIGNLTRDVKLTFTPNGTAVAKTGLAVNPYVPKGEPKPDPLFYELTIFGDLGEHTAQCLAKGDRVVVVGRGSIEPWTGDDGKNRTTKKIIVDGIGPDLRWINVTLNQTERSGPKEAAAQGVFDEEDPF